MTTFIVPEDGFLDLEKQYFLFVWMPPKTKTYMIANSYLIQDGTVFPLNIEPDVSAYKNGMPLKAFEARIESAIDKNIDTD